MSEFAGTGSYYNFHDTSGVNEAAIFEHTLEGFAHDPEHFSVVGFEYQYSSQELDFLKAISNRYQELGLHSHAITETPLLLSASTTTSLSCETAQIIYTRINPAGHRHAPLFTALWQPVMATATAYVGIRSTWLCKENNLEESIALTKFVKALQALAHDFQTEEDNDWLGLLGPSSNKQRYAAFAGFICLFETLTRT
jgi:hypothetical protein